MEIKKTTLNQIEIFEISGRIDANNANDFEKILVQTVDRFESLIFLFKSYVIKNRFE